MPRYTFTTEGCAEHFEHPDDETALRAARDWARTGLYDARKVEISVWEEDRHVGDFDFWTSPHQRDKEHKPLGRKPRHA